MTDAPVELAAARETKKQLAEAHELMAQSFRDAKAYVTACSNMLDALVAPSQEMLDKRTRQLHRAALEVLASADAYAKKFIRQEPKEKTE